MATIKPGSQTSAGSKVGFAFQEPLNNVSAGEGRSAAVGGLNYQADGYTKTYAPLIALQANIGPIASFKDMPVELTGAAYPTEVYKDGQVFGGKLTFIPRLVGAFPWILLGVVGWASEGVNDASFTDFNTFRFLPPWAGSGLLRDGTTTPTPGSVEEAAASHYLFPDEALSGAGIKVDEKYLPWMEWISELPDGNGSIGHDCLINGLTLTIPQQGPVSAQLSIIGKTGTLYTTPSTNFSDVTDAFDGVMMAADATITTTGLSGASMYGARISFMNNLTGVQEEQVVGSSSPETFTVKRRVVQIETTVKWKDATLAAEMLSGSTSGTNYTSVVANGGSFTVELPSIKAKGVTTGADNAKHKLTFYAPKMIWRPNGPIMPDVKGDGMLTQDYVGIVSDDGKNPYYYLDLYTTQHNTVFSGTDVASHRLFFVPHA